MSDIRNIRVRSFNMSQIKGKNTKPELLVRKYLFAKGFRYRLHDKNLPGKPDIILPKYNTIIFVNGCFWHGHICEKNRMPSTNKKFWELKIHGNIERDKKVQNSLESAGWKVFTIWTCELKNSKIAENTLKSLLDKITAV